MKIVLKNIYLGNKLRTSTRKRLCDALRDLVSFIQFEKREKSPWRNVTFSKVAGFSCTNNTKSRNASQLRNPATFHSVCSIFKTNNFICH